MRRVLLVFDDQKELEFIEANLVENGFEIFKSADLKSALLMAEKTIPDLIVLNTMDSEKDLKDFSKQVKRINALSNASVLSLIELESYLAITKDIQHFIVKPVRPKLLLSLIRSIMNNEEVNWLPAMHW